MGKIVLFGELMLRLKPFGKERFFQSPSLNAVFGGSEANVAVSLSKFKKDTRFVTALPSNPLGEAALSSLRYYGVSVEAVQKEGRLGLYFLENGACQRPSNVIYDRENSVFSLAKPDEYDWDSIFEDAQWLHISGVTPAISENTALCTKRAFEEAKKRGVRISLDLNYRKKLWKWGKTASEVMRELSSYADVLIANEEDVQNCLNIPLENRNTPSESYKVLCKNVKKEFPNVKYVAVTFRHSVSADINFWTCFLDGKEGFYESTRYEIQNIVERVGAGDSFAAGLIYALSSGDSFSRALSSGKAEFSEGEALDFAAAAGCLKHSIHGDYNLSTKEEVLALAKGNGSGRIQR